MNNSAAQLIVHCLVAEVNHLDMSRDQISHTKF